MPGPIKPLRFAEMIYQAGYHSPRPDLSYTPQIRDTVHFSKEALEKLKTHSARKHEDYPDETPQQGDDVQSSLATLDLEPGATIEQIKKAYLEAIKKYHPDSFASLPKEFQRVAEEKTKQLNQAYSTLRRKPPAG
ncbi:MAG: DnaJ family molecular chaperone [Syntrophobacteraceae bacterium]